jgi:hypothetical protein
MFHHIARTRLLLIQVFTPLRQFSLRIIHIVLLADKTDDLICPHYLRNELNHISLFNLLRCMHFIEKLSVDNVPFIMIEMSFS